MPRFFADIDDGLRADVDDTGFEATDAAAAMRLVARALTDMAHDRTAKSAECAITAILRDETGERARFDLTLRVTPPQTDMNHG